MTSTGLISLLHDLDYQQAGQLRSAQLNIVFNDWNLRRFFDFLITSVTKENNFVTDEEMKRFIQLKSYGRVVTDPEQRQFRLNRKQNSADKADSGSGRVEDAGTIEWSRSRLEAARSRLENLKQLENRLSKLCQQKQEAQKKLSDGQATLVIRQKIELKQAQVHLISIDMQFQDASKRLAKELEQGKSLVCEPTALCSIFFSPTMVDQCLSSVQQTMINLNQARAKIQAGLDSPPMRTQDHLNDLHDALYNIYLRKFMEEISLTEAKAQLQHLRGFQCRSADITRKCTEEDKARRISLQQTLTDFVQHHLLEYAMAATDIRVVKAMMGQCQRNVERINLAMETEKEILAALNMEANRLAIMKMIISVEKQHVEEKGIEPLTRIQNCQRDRAAWIHQCQSRLHIINSVSRKMSARSNREGRQNVNGLMDSTGGQDDDTKRARTILDLVHTCCQSFEIRKALTGGVPILDQAVARYECRLHGIEKALLQYIKEYEKKDHS